jgi:hypothetical protein
LCRFGDQSKKPRGQKIPAGQSYSAQDKEEEDSKEEDDVEESTEEETSEEEDSRQEKEEGSRHEELEDEELPEPHPGASSPKLRTSVVAIYEGQWFLADVAESQEKVGHGYTRLSYAAIKGTNCFTWTDKPDIMVTLNEDIILSKVNVVPLNNRSHVGLTKQDLKKWRTGWLWSTFLLF